MWIGHNSPSALNTQVGHEPRTTNLDEIASLYHGGSSSFFADWQEFTSSETPVVINRAPRLVLVAHDYHGRTASALDFLVENGLPIRVISVSMYEDASGRRFLDLSGDHEPELGVHSPTPVEGTRQPAAYTRIDGRRVTIADLLEHDLLKAGDELVWTRTRIGTEYRATVCEDAMLELEDGRRIPSPSWAAIRAANVSAVDGWYAWRVVRLGGLLLNELRKELARVVAESPTPAE
jgi:hypothetical protein